MSKLEKIKFRTHYNFQLSESDQEKPIGESMTVPGQAYTMREILLKYTSGNVGDLQKNGYGDENPDFDDLDITRNPDFDLSDYTEENNYLQEKLKLSKNSKNSKKTTKEKSQTDDDSDDVNFEPKKAKVESELVNEKLETKKAKNES